MSDKKKTRNFAGTIRPRKIVRHGKTVTIYEARKRYAETDADGNFILDVNGKKRYKEKTQRCFSISEAQIALLNLPERIRQDKHMKARSEHGDRSGHTLFELTEYFRSHYCKKAVIVHGQQIVGYRQNVNNIKKYLEEFEQFFGNVSLARITYERLREFDEHISTRPIQRPGATQLPKRATVNRKLAYLRRLLNVGKQLRWIQTNPFQEGRALIKVKGEQSRERILTYDEERRLLAACVDADKVSYTMKAASIEYTRRDKIVKFERQQQLIEYTHDNQRPHLRLPVLLAIDGGLRKKEIFSLERKDILLDQHVIDIPAEKTKALRRRVVILSPRLESELREYFRRFAFYPTAPIFFGQKDCDRAFTTAVRNAGIEDLRFHDLRHTATSWMDQAGISQPVKQSMIGHADPRTHQIYHNLSSDIVDAVRRKMADFEAKKTMEKMNGT
jgi:integrase